MQPQSQPIKDMAASASSKARQLGGKAADRLHSAVDTRKGEVASQAQRVSGTFQRVADDLDTDAPDWLRSAIATGARQAQAFADSIEHKDSRELVGDVMDFARKSPATFLGVCAAAGFAAARVLKSGTRSASSTGHASEDFDLVDQQAAAEPAFPLPGGEDPVARSGIA